MGKMKTTSLPPACSPTRAVSQTTSAPGCWRIRWASVRGRAEGIGAPRSYAPPPPARPCGRTREKPPRHVEHVGKLFACFPQARLLYIHRHPVDVYSSYVRRGQTDPPAAWGRTPLEEVS